MRRKLLAILFLVGFAALSYAQRGVIIEAGQSQKDGNSYTFPNLRVKKDLVGLGMLEFDRMTIEVTDGVVSELPELPEGWELKGESTASEKKIKFRTTPPLPDVNVNKLQTFLRGVKFSVEPGKKGGRVKLNICFERIYPSIMETRASSERRWECTYDYGVFGYESAKTAKVNSGAENKGTATSPVSVLLGDEIEYKIVAVNASQFDESSQALSMELRSDDKSTLIIEDKLPEGLELVTGSISDGGALSGGVIKWELNNVPIGGDRTVTFKVKLKVPLQEAFYQNNIENEAKVTTKWTETIYGSENDITIDKVHVSTTNKTYHKRQVCKVEFKVDPAAGGNLTNGADQYIDYNTKPATGVTVTPAANYEFVKWKHGGFASLKAGEAATPAATGPDNDANWYSTIPVKGNVVFTAEMKLKAFEIKYDLNDKDRSPAPKNQEMPLATPPTTANPTSYIQGGIPAGGLALNPPTRTGFDFTGWKITNDDNSLNIVDNKIPSNASGNLLCTAQWTPKQFTVTYKEKGSGTVIPAGSNPGNYSLYTLPDSVKHPAPPKPNHQFVGWTGKFAPTPVKKLEILLKEGDTWTQGDLVYEAEYKEVDHKITYDFNDDKTINGVKMPEVPNKTELEGKYPVGYKVSGLPMLRTAINPDPARIGYTFKEWTVTKVAGGAVVSDATHAITAGTTGDLKAKASWKPDTFNITYDFDEGVGPTTPNPADYTIETLPKTVGQAPTRAGYVFIGWQGVSSVGLSAQIAPTPKRTVVIPVKNGDVWTLGDLKFKAVWHKAVSEDKGNCEPPMTFQGVAGAKGYKWEYRKSATEWKEVGTQQAYDAKKSGTYILHTNYGDTIVVDTFKVKFAFEGKMKLTHDNAIANKVGRTQKFRVKITMKSDTAGLNPSYVWSFSDDGRMITASPQDTAEIVFNTPGEKTVNVKITVTLPGGLVCTKELSDKLNIYEKYHGFFVDQHVVGGRGDGSSWANAYKRIEQALDKARAGDCVWVARGTYTPPKGKSYEMKYDSVQDVAGGVSSAARWDGFIVEQGKATKGGGIYNEGSVTIANSIIRGNRADEGGGIYNNGGAPVIYNTEISGNTAKDGAAMYNSSSSPRLTNVTISGNLASSNGGGLYNDNSNPAIQNTIIWGNRAAQHPNVSNTSSTPNFTFSLIEKNRAGWDVSLGANGGNNIDGDPLFRKKGFDESGNMQPGNYRFFAKSPAENQGYNSYVFSETTRDAHLPTLGESVYHKGFPYDLSGLNRIIDDRVDIGAYEYAPDLTFPSLSRSIEIPQVEGLTIQPRPGIHYVLTGKDFTFTVSEKKEEAMLKAGEEKRLIERLGIKTGIPAQDKDGIKMTENEDGSVTVTLLKVSASIRLTIDPYAKPNSAKTISNDNVWSYDGNVMLSLSERSDVRIYDMKGQLMVHRTVDAGETAIPLSEGFYVVRVGERNYKILVK